MQRLDAGLRLLAHRGPDDQGGWIDHSHGAQVALGHRRLSIIDLSNGAQPMRSVDGRYVITFNGEIYNYIELAAELRELGHVFCTASDTEVLMEAYRAWGEGFVTRLRGMFAFALFDQKTGDLVLARDPFGKKPLFLADLPGGFIFSSEVAPLLQMPGVDGSIAEDVIGEYLFTRYVVGPKTMFRGIRKLPPGHLLVHRNGRSQLTSFFELPFLTVAPEPMSMAEAVERFRFHLEEAVKLRMRSEAPFGAYLSGGLDSSLVVALMARNSRGPVKTFTVGFEDERLSELQYARRVAAAHGTDHNEVVVTSRAFFDSWEDAVRFRGAPVSEASDIPILVLSRMARSHVKMVLTGEGADELLGGYRKYRAERYIRWYNTFIPPHIHRALVEPVAVRLPYEFRRLKILSQALGASSFKQRESTWFASAPIDLIQRLLGHEVRIANSTDSMALPSWMGAARSLQLNDQLAWLSDNLLERGDRMMMAGSIEGRMPFMDVVLAKEVARIPDRYLSVGGGKLVARKAGAALLGPEVIGRAKIGFEVPLGQWFRNEERERLLDLLASRSACIRDVLRPSVLDGLLEMHMSGRQNFEKILWAVANLELFMREFASGSNPPAYPQSNSRPLEPMI